MPPVRASRRPWRSAARGGLARGRLPWATAALVVLALALVALAVVTTGSQLFVVQSPSMGRAAPVGTLVVTEPTALDRVRVGDVVVYRAPGSPSTTTHRVVGVSAAGLAVRGDINGADDALPVTSSMLVGRAVALVPGAGTAVRLLPWLVIGVVSVLLLTWPLRRQRRSGLRMIGITTVVTVVSMTQRPLVGWTLLDQQPLLDAMRATIVSTGLLPVRLDAGRGVSATAVPGEVVRLRLPVDVDGAVHFTAGPGLEPWGWVLLVLVCLSPLIAVLLVGLPVDEREPVGR